MTLKEIRTWFIQISGRYDLVEDAVDFVDKGANVYIKAGQRYLDRGVTQKKGTARAVNMLEVGQYLMTFSEIRAIQEVWCARDQIGRWLLEKKDFDWIRQAFPNMDTLTNGTPMFYCPAVLETVTPPAEGFDGLMNYLGDMTGDDATSYNGVIIFPPPDVQTMVEVFGYVYKKSLVEDTDTNFWSLEHPELLVMSAQLILEKFNRNTEGVRDWKESIGEHLDAISKDLAEEESEDVDEMEGFVNDGFSRTRARRRNRGQTWYW